MTSFIMIEEHEPIRITITDDTRPTPPYRIVATDRHGNDIGDARMNEGEFVFIEPFASKAPLWQFFKWLKWRRDRRTIRKIIDSMCGTCKAHYGRIRLEYTTVYTDGDDTTITVVCADKEVEKRVMDRIERLRELGYDEPSFEERRDNLNKNIAMLGMDRKDDE